MTKLSWTVYAEHSQTLELEPRCDGFCVQEGLRLSARWNFELVYCAVKALIFKSKGLPK